MTYREALDRLVVAAEEWARRVRDPWRGDVRCTVNYADAHMGDWDEEELQHALCAARAAEELRCVSAGRASLISAGVALAVAVWGVIYSADHLDAKGLAVAGMCLAIVIAAFVNLRQVLGESAERDRERAWQDVARKLRKRLAQGGAADNS